MILAIALLVSFEIIPFDLGAFGGIGGLAGAMDLHHRQIQALIKRTEKNNN